MQVLLEMSKPATFIEHVDGEKKDIVTLSRHTVACIASHSKFAQAYDNVP